MSPGARTGILGGTLDPIHLGHVETARAARDALALDRVILIPSHVPPHRQDAPRASAFHRFAMAALAAAEHEWMTLSDDELRSGGRSFTADTLDRLHASGLDKSQLFFIAGADAFAEIETWHRFPDVLDLARFAVVSRPGLPVSRLGERLPSLRGRFVAPGNDACEGGGIVLVDAATPDISSTAIRRRLAAGEPVTGLVSPLVERHIQRHRLYAS